MYNSSYVFFGPPLNNKIYDDVGDVASRKYKKKQKIQSYHKTSIRDNQRL